MFGGLFLFVINNFNSKCSKATRKRIETSFTLPQMFVGTYLKNKILNELLQEKRTDQSSLLGPFWRTLVICIFMDLACE